MSACISRMADLGLTLCSVPNDETACDGNFILVKSLCMYSVPVSSSERRTLRLLTYQQAVLTGASEKTHDVSIQLRYTARNSARAVADTQTSRLTLWYHRHNHDENEIIRHCESCHKADETKGSGQKARADCIHHDAVNHGGRPSEGHVCPPSVKEKD